MKDWGDQKNSELEGEKSTGEEIYEIHKRDYIKREIVESIIGRLRFPDGTKKPLRVIYDYFLYKKKIDLDERIGVGGSESIPVYIIKISTPKYLGEVEISQLKEKKDKSNNLKQKINSLEKELQGV